MRSAEVALPSRPRATCRFLAARTRIRTVGQFMLLSSIAKFVLFRDQLFPPIGEAHALSNKARAAFRSFGLGAGGFSSNSMTRRLSRLVSLTPFVLIDDGLGFTQQGAKDKGGHIVCASATARMIKAFVGGSDAQSHSFAFVNGCSGHGGLLVRTL